MEGPSADGYRSAASSWHWLSARTDGTEEHLLEWRYREHKEIGVSDGHTNGGYWQLNYTYS